MSDDDVLLVDIESLKISEIEEIEEKLGVPFDEMWVEGKPKARALRAVAWVVRKRSDPEFTWEQAGDLVVRAVASTVDPTDAAGS